MKIDTQYILDRQRRPPVWYNDLYCAFLCPDRCEKVCARYLDKRDRPKKLSQDGTIKYKYKKHRYNPKVPIQPILTDIKKWPSSLRLQRCIDEFGCLPAGQ